MKASLSWLQTYVTVEMDIDRLAHVLTMAGLEVEAVYDRFDFLKSVLVGRITAVDPHPRADKLKLCQVQAGRRSYCVVCGAPNAAVGLLAPLAMPGTAFPDGNVLTETTIRGRKSQGMLCSEVEIGLGLDGSGLMVLDDALTPGTPLNQAMTLSDPVLDIDLTPNRPDCLSIIGIAREIAAYQGTALKRPTIQLPETHGNIQDFTSIIIDAPDHCPRYSACLLDNISVAPSPFWLQDRLISVGLRPINNLVDITNFVMMETGQPMHAFDFDQLAENRIVVRTARSGETFTTLDEKERVLNDEMLMICDGQKPVGIGGVMGGMNSEISPGTTRVLLESACFNPISIRKTSKRLGLNTDAAHRFERGTDPQGTLFALDRAAELMARLGQGRLIGGTIDVIGELPRTSVIDLSVSDTNRLLGTELTRETVTGLLSAIEFEVNQKDEDTLTVNIPSFRVDVSRPQDLMEEVARRSGYNNIPVTYPNIPATGLGSSKLLSQRQRIRGCLAGLGFSEAITYSFIHSASCNRLRLPENDPRRDEISILNPLSEDQAVMRTSLAPGLLETMQRNLARQSKTLKLFEIGKTFIHQKNNSLPLETEILAGLWTGDRHIPGWYTKPVACDFYDLKGVLENLLDELDIQNVVFTQLPAEQCTYTRPGASAQIYIEKKAVGVLGEIHEQVLRAYDLKQSGYIFELDLSRLIDLIPDGIRAQSLPRYPATTRDATLIVDQDLEAGAVLTKIRQLKQDLVEEVRLFDVFQGQPVPENRKSISLRIVYRSTEKTLEDETVNQIHKEITAQLVSEFKADLPA